MKLSKQSVLVKKITVVTNSLEAIVVLANRDNVRLVVIGGTYDNNNLSMGGAMTSKFIDHYYVDKTFFSVKGISKERGIMDSKEEIAELKSMMVKNTRQAILVIDGSKFDKSALVRAINPSEVDVIITDHNLDEEWQSYFEDNGIDAIVVS